MMTRIFSFLAALCFLIGAAHSAQAQTRWLQTVQVIAPVDDYNVAGIFRDSLVQAIQRGGITLRREPGEREMSFRALEDDLFSEGLDYTSANQVFITYKLEASQRGFQSQIQDIYFIYRPEGFEDVDLPILHVDGREPAVRRVIVSGGTQMFENEAAFEPFYDQLAFHQLENSTVVAIGGRVIRDPERQTKERERLLATVQRFIY